MLACRVVWWVITSRRCGRRLAEPQPSSSRRSTCVVRGTAGGSATARVRRWRARRRFAPMTAGGGRHPLPRGFRAGRPSSASGAGPGPGRGTAWPGPVARVDFGLALGYRSNKSQMPSVFTTVWSCIRPGRNAPAHRVRPCSSVTTVAFWAFWRIFPETTARRPGLFAPGRRTRTSVPSNRSSMPSAAAQAKTSFKVRSRRSRCPGTAKPRAASSGRISWTARVIVERSTP